MLRHHNQNVRSLQLKCWVSIFKMLGRCIIFLISLFSPKRRFSDRIGRCTKLFYHIQAKCWIPIVEMSRNIMPSCRYTKHNVRACRVVSERGFSEAVSLARNISRKCVHSFARLNRCLHSIVEPYQATRLFLSCQLIRPRRALFATQVNKTGQVIVAAL